VTPGLQSVLTHVNPNPSKKSVSDVFFKTTLPERPRLGAGETVDSPSFVQKQEDYLRQVWTAVSKKVPTIVPQQEPSHDPNDSEETYHGKYEAYQRSFGLETYLEHQLQLQEHRNKKLENKISFLCVLVGTLMKNTPASQISMEDILKELNML